MVALVHPQIPMVALAPTQNQTTEVLGVPELAAIAALTSILKTIQAIAMLAQDAQAPCLHHIAPCTAHPISTTPIPTA